MILGVIVYPFASVIALLLGFLSLTWRRVHRIATAYYMLSILNILAVELVALFYFEFVSTFVLWASAVVLVLKVCAST